MGFEEKGYDFLPTMQTKRISAVKRRAIIGVVWVRFCLGGYIIILQLGHNWLFQDYNMVIVLLKWELSSFTFSTNSIGR